MRPLSNQTHIPNYKIIITTITAIRSISMASFMIAIILLLLLSLYTIFLLLTGGQNHRKTSRKLPPGPRPLPIIGNLHQLGTLPHRSLQKLAQKHGPIMSLKLGTIQSIVLSSPKAASLFLKTHDTNFASRPKLQASEYVSYGSKGMAFSEYGPYWRSVRKLCTSQLLSGSKTESFAKLRKEVVGCLVESVKKSAVDGEVVDLSGKISEVVEDIATTMIFGKKSRDDRYNLKGLAQELLSLAGAFNLADCVPFLGVLDLQGLRKRMKKASNFVDQVLENIISEHQKDTNPQHQDFVNVLLPLMNQPLNPQDEHVYIIDRTNIKAILLDLMVAAFDTSATTIDWTIAELLKNRRVMKKLQDELQSVIGMDKMVEENDLAKLSYLDMVVKESFRLHPIAPLLVPRECIEDTIIEEHWIPKKSRVMVNAWAIGHDPNVWSENVEEFYPERFIERNIDLKGHDFELLPFGSGRRMCPGMQSGLTIVRLVLAQILHCFDWELPSGMQPKDIDMAEIFGLSVARANHLLLKPTYRLIGKTT
ncbi:cytochrome P450 CYP736A12 [Ziziphus jujuba]|uniref:Cytochrome P450 CYP736A12 n=1 Tax=Ziziphus jujuba TaxID=326968 RepID=A0A6P4A4L3_ZIZJJ|nr:cytochrome P450 CYP736A12 [Ziziphus jujuba]